MDLDCRIGVEKSAAGPALLLFHANNVRLPKLVQAVVSETLTSEDEGKRFAVWYSLPLLIHGGSRVTYECPAGQYVRITETGGDR